MRNDDICQVCGGYARGGFGIHLRCAESIAVERERLRTLVPIELLEARDRIMWLEKALLAALPYMEAHGLRLANDHRSSTSDATRREGDALLDEVERLRTVLDD